MHGNFALIWDKMLESSLWIKESKETRIVWITMLVMKDKNGCIYSSIIGLADRAKVLPSECREALQILLAPDPDDTSKVMEGRRLIEIKGGWQIVNHEAYRFSTEARRQYWRDQKAKSRAKQKEKGGPPSREAAAKAHELDRKFSGEPMHDAPPNVPQGTVPRTLPNPPPNRTVLPVSQMMVPPASAAPPAE